MFFFVVLFDGPVFLPTDGPSPPSPPMVDKCCYCLEGDLFCSLRGALLALNYCSVVAFVFLSSM